MLNDNGIATLRELANQISLPPLHFPIKQIISDIDKEDDDASPPSDLNDSGSIDNNKNNVNNNGDYDDGFEDLVEFGGSDKYLNRLPRRTIMDYALVYRAKMKSGKVIAIAIAIVIVIVIV